MDKFITKEIVSELFPKRNENANKGSFLKILNISGSRMYSGAAYLSSIAALKIGAGFVCLACPEEIICRIAPNMPEVVFKPLNSNKNGSISFENDLQANKYDIISIGCGLSTDADTSKFVINFLQKYKGEKKLVVDADAINILSNYSGDNVLKNAIITPHPKELSRLLNVPLTEILDNREKYARLTSQKFECITVLKGKNTIVTDGNKILINTTGSSALAKAGSGDVLTGFISGLLSQGLNPFESAICGVFIHGLSGDYAADDLTEYSVLASDLFYYLPFATDDILSEE